jgi:hypothetical protein
MWTRDGAAAAWVSWPLVLLALLRLSAGAWAWRVGASSASVLPTVAGRTDYWQARAPPDTDSESLGTFVPAFDVGPVPVGNGRERSHWVRDDVRTYAVALDAADTDEGDEDPPANRTHDGAPRAHRDSEAEECTFTAPP